MVNLGCILRWEGRFMKCSLVQQGTSLRASGDRRHGKAIYQKKLIAWRNQV